MDQLKKDFNNEILRIIGNRTKDGYCAFCGEKLSENEYCDCPQAEKSNKYFKKTSKFIANINDRLVLSTSLKDARKALNATSNTPKLIDRLSFDDYKVECDSV